MAETRVYIEAGKGYDVVIGGGLLDRCGALLRPVVAPCAVAVVTDTTVQALYLARVLDSLRAAGYAVCSTAFPAGEGAKNMRTLAELLEFLAERRLTRADCVLALGGGVAGDLAGFAAGCFLRGVRFVQMPTTLLAAVDSSVGGKTAVDLAAGKNLAGLFLQPEAVLCDPDVFATLPDAVLADGLAEAVKTAVLSGEALLSLLEAPDALRRLPEIVAACVRYKGAVVEEDEFEHGLRKTLNLGHTVGHAIERLSGYTVPHGHAVAAGLAVTLRAAERRGYTEAPCADRICALLRRFGLPTDTAYSASALAEAARTDKKRAGDRITLALPSRVGDCRLAELPLSGLAGFLSAGLEE